MFKIIRFFFPSLPSSMNILVSFMYDASRFMKYNTNNNYRGNKRKHQAILLRRIHGLEKAFSLPKMKQFFGSMQASSLLEALEYYLSKYKSDEIVKDALNVLHNYYLYHEGIKEKQIEELLVRYENLVKVFDLSFQSKKCYVTFENNKIIRWKEFSEFFKSRYSVRNFKNEIIPNSLVEEAIDIALKTPSAGNRQPWKVRIYTSERQRKSVLKVQNGNRGFTESIYNVAVISGHLSHFSSKERNEVYIDGGMFSMSLMLAFHSLGISTCALNLSYQAKELAGISKIFGFSKDEVPIVMLAFGIASDNVRCARSERLNVKKFIEYID